MTTESVSKEQVCLRMTPAAYKLLTAITNKFKNAGVRKWTNSAVMNLMIVELGDKYLGIEPKESCELYKDYEKLCK